ncbi:MAG: phosphatase PAP2 family protein [Prevotella sp.]|nr:phosphatase PAP2 family protein [Prevotella sp.]MDY4039012.1 phosphatase PAP2 family protein [Prevotella sp.]
MYSFYLIILYIILVAMKPTRKVALALAPWLIFACSYDWMRLYPNYKVNPIDVKGLYDAEKEIFGIATTQGLLIPSEYFGLHHSVLSDLLAGFFYLCWVPVPLAFSLWLYFKKQYNVYLHFTIAFLFVNLLGFCGYYIHPAAPPWYAMKYGFTPILTTPGNVAGLGRFDLLTGIPVFHSIYGKNANIFAAIPSLHAAYMLITTIYAVKSKQKIGTIIVFALICMGIWWTAVYSGHHYIIDVVLGITTALIGILLLERLLFKIPQVERFLSRYSKAISQ